LTPVEGASAANPISPPRHAEQKRKKHRVRGMGGSTTQSGDFPQSAVSRDRHIQAPRPACPMRWLRRPTCEGLRHRHPDLMAKAPQRLGFTARSDDLRRHPPGELAVRRPRARWRRQKSSISCCCQRFSMTCGIRGDHTHVIAQTGAACGLWSSAQGSAPRLRRLRQEQCGGQARQRADRCCSGSEKSRVTRMRNQ